ncbi:Uncharacterised protein [Mycobacteroides abscessus]|nr:Uncharacterised protein [Mycobacteroides abscessus]CPZ91641.1 Uncharacterised protein [Mycobacteroides abscessus]CPZ94064.1 Uncharacterised protein [Mycobacteroides abscessus]SLC93858.1 Uncharacterised protein [Mycobacteroides abscessus subsp. massiliense]
MAMMASKADITYSKERWPRRSCTVSSAIETIPVMTPPRSSGRPNNRCSAMAPPTTSAKSVAMATNSACSQNVSRVGRAMRSPIASGSDCPVTRPSFAERYCTSPAITLAVTITQTSKKPYLAPALTFEATFPGST